MAALCTHFERECFKKRDKLDGRHQNTASSISILVTLCNLPQAGSSGLLLVEHPGDSRRLVDIGAAGQCVGCTGLAISDSLLYCAWIGPGQGSFVSILDASSLAVLECVPLNEIKDVHSICVCDSWLYLVSTGTDEVRRVGKTRVGRETEVVWRASSSGCDTHHVNSILTCGTQLLCSAFGLRTGERWSTAVDGYVIDIGSSHVMYRGLEHPHSLALGSDDIYVVESRRARVRGLRGGTCFAVDGYARGLVFLPDWGGIVGTSRGRARSLGLGTVENPADPGEVYGTSRLAVFGALDKTGLESPDGIRIDLTNYGPEIYDIATL
ncbi:MAG TPA: hypothetical protein VFT21_06910 [Gemmatimonadaceae bacterium]|nr:hypothetical protein [Gemmatimonadaceae bacterium]